MRDFRTLRAWRHGHQFVLRIYEVTAGFPPSERYGLASQLRRSAASITATLAEGAAAGTDAEQRRFYRMSFRTSCETLNHLLLARDLGLLSTEAFDELEARLEPLRRMIYRLAERSV